MFSSLSISILEAILISIEAASMFGTDPDITRASTGFKIHIRPINGIISAPIEVVACTPATAKLLNAPKYETVKTLSPIFMSKFNAGKSINNNAKLLLRGAKIATMVMIDALSSMDAPSSRDMECLLV